MTFIVSFAGNVSLDIGEMCCLDSDSTWTLIYCLCCMDVSQDLWVLSYFEGRSGSFLAFKVYIFCGLLYFCGLLLSFVSIPQIE